MTTHNETSTVNDNTIPPSVSIIEGINDQVTIWDATNSLQALLVQITTRLNKLENQANGDTDKSILKEFEKLSLDVKDAIIRLDEHDEVISDKVDESDVEGQVESFIENQDYICRDDVNEMIETRIGEIFREIASNM
jgi:predicted sulfurtransferase